MVDLPFAHWSKLTPAVRAINMALWHALYGCVIGKRVADDELVRIGDSERKSGLYILGKPRMGKTWLIVNMILQDIERGDGVFFLDPHGDAIDDLLNRTTSGVLVFDPEDENYSFGINLLECANVDNVAARNHTFNKAKGVFDKLWKNTFEDKPWLQLILQNTIYAFIETPSLTLLELPIFYRSRDFRDYVVDNIRYNWQVRDYWQRTFASKSLHDQNEQMEAAQTRAEIMLAHPYVSDIVGQTHTTIDFAKILDEKKIVLVKLSNRLSYEAKTIIGTILVSELLHAIEHRSEGRREQFCIYIDEFQNFASYQDFPILITQAPKYGIATTLAHHERYGQLTGCPGIIGATAAIANKVLFQITARDGQELAPEFAEAPTTETRYEEKYIISRQPVYDLLRWHDNPHIKQFANKYIRPLKERLEDIRGESEAERVTRMEDLDTASLFRLEERLESVERIEANPDRMRGSLSSAGRALTSARTKSGKLISLTDEATNLRLTFRDLNKFLTAIMEGEVAPGQDVYSSFLIDRIAGLSTVTNEERQILEIYVRLAYGGPEPTLTMPFNFAKDHGLFFSDTVMAEISAEVEYRRRKEQQRVKYQAYLSEELEKFIGYVKDTERYLALYGELSYKDERYKEQVRNLAEYKEKREDLEQNSEAKVDEYMRNFDTNYKGKEIRKGVAPKIIYVKVKAQTDKDRVMNACVGELGSTGTRALQIIREFVGFCTLLADPENHITKKSGQHVAKQVSIRTEADMSNEMVRNLTSLPKYTAYAKVLQNEGRNLWKGKIRTRELRATNEGKADTSETWHYIQLRARIREEIVERHDRLLGESGGESRPPPASY